MVLVKEALFEQTHSHGSAVYISVTCAEQIAKLRTFYGFFQDFAEEYDPGGSVFFKLRRNFFSIHVCTTQNFQAGKISCGVTDCS